MPTLTAQPRTRHIAVQTAFFIAIHHGGRWHPAPAGADRADAIANAAGIYQRCGLPIEVRQEDGSVIRTFGCETIVLPV